MSSKLEDDLTIVGFMKGSYRTTTIRDIIAKPEFQNYGFFKATIFPFTSFLDKQMHFNGPRLFLNVDYYLFGTEP